MNSILINENFIFWPDFCRKNIHLFIYFALFYWGTVFWVKVCWQMKISLFCTILWGKKIFFFFFVNLYGIIVLIPPSNILLIFMIRFVLVSESLCHVSTKVTTFKPQPCERFISVSRGMNTALTRWSLRKKCPYSELFSSVLSRIRTEYGKIWSFSVWMRENTYQNNSQYGYFWRSGYSYLTSEYI